jgi:putative glutamine amidotransferase
VLEGIYGRDHLRVNSVHYQGIDRLGEGLTVEAVAPDGLIEAFSANISGSQVLGVQWHPEWQVDRYPESQAYFHGMGQALRGMPLR